jgi:autophagy-related protein 101
MEQLVNTKVDAFWKGIEGGANKHGQVCLGRIKNVGAGTYG